MKKMYSLLLCIFLCNLVFSQTKAKEYFLERSKKQKTTAWILLGTGTAAILGGLIIDGNVDDGEQSYTGGFFEVGGFICTLASIPFFIGSAKNKKRATTLTFNNQLKWVPLGNGFAVKRQGMVSVVIDLKKGAK